jgi:Ni,Fe-hydrogenase I cytochrome b subunit
MEDNTKLPVSLADIQDQINKLHDMLNEKYSKLIEDAEHFDQEKQSFNSTHKILMTFKDPIKLNIGGKIFMTSRSTLMKKDSMFKSMFSGRYELEVIKIESI